MGHLQHILVQISFLRWFYPSISDNMAWKRKPPLCHPDPDFLPRSTGQGRVCAFP
jgi:hypothetical protein